MPEIKLTYSSDDPRNKTRFEWMQNQLKKNLGIEIQLDPVEAKTFVAMAMKKDAATQPQITRSGWCSSWSSDRITTPLGSRRVSNAPVTLAADAITRLYLYRAYSGNFCRDKS